MNDAAKTYNGSCHCGNVEFSICTKVQELTTCNCSLCRLKNAVMLKVHDSEFALETDWQLLSEYRWNTQVARHFFCNRCGIYTFHRKRAQPDHYGINVFCLDGFDAAQFQPRETGGSSMSLECDHPRSEWLKA